LKQALVIGDSHVDTTVGMVNVLHDVLGKLGYDAQFAGLGGATARDWLKGLHETGKVSRVNGSKTVQVADLPKGVDLLIVSLGTNDAAVYAKEGGNPAKLRADLADKVVSEVSQIAAYFTPKATLWLGPPWLNPAKPGAAKWNTNETIQDVYDAAVRAGVPVFDSRRATYAPVQAGAGDGVHVGKAGYVAWADAVGVQVASTLAGVKTVGWVVAGLAFAGLLLLRKRVAGVA
jgi:lysophospholipase L1-like esterase